MNAKKGLGTLNKALFNKGVQYCDKIKELIENPKLEQSLDEAIKNIGGLHIKSYLLADASFDRKWNALNNNLQGQSQRRRNLAKLGYFAALYRKAIAMGSLAGGKIGLRFARPAGGAAVGAGFASIVGALVLLRSFKKDYEQDPHLVGVLT